MDITLESLAKSIENVKALQACRNIMARYCYYHTAFRHKAYVENCWAKREDCCLKMPWGAYLGIEGVKRCYLQEHGDRSDPRTYETLKGAMFMHCLDTECLEVAEDGQTARGVWVSPGHETAVRGDDIMANWCWGKYAVDFIKEGGEWRIWHLQLFPLFNTPYETRWTDIPPFNPGDFSGGDDKPKDIPEDMDIPRSKPDMPLDDVYVWTKDAVYPVDQPAPPLPYNTFADVAPGYGV